jgi:hypothetical protein
MRKLVILFALLSLALPALGGTSAVTATITDADSQTWNNGSFQVTFVPLAGTNASDYNVNGSSFTQFFTGQMNGSGVLTVTLTDLSTVTPTGGQWRFTLCPNASSVCASVITNAVVGATPNLSTQLSTGLAGPRFATGPSAFGYSDTEVSPTPQPGGLYYSVTSAAVRVWSGTAWSSLGTGSGTVTSVTGTPPVTSTGGATPAIGCATCAIGPGASTANHVAEFSGTDGVTLKDGGTAGTGTVTNTGGSLPANAVVLGNTSPDIKADTGLSTDGAGAVTDAQGTITTSKPLMTHTVTWNAGGVAFTNWLDTVTCTAAATGSILAGWGTSGTQFQFKYAAANCASPQFLLPNGSTASPSLSFSAATTSGFQKGTNSGGPLAVVSGVDIGDFNASGLRIISSGVFGITPGAPDAANADTGWSRGAAGISLIGTGAAASRAGLLLSGNSVFVTSNFTTAANTNLQTITGLSWTFPAAAFNWNFHCHLAYSQATGTAAVAFGIQAATNAPTNIFATGEMFTAAGTVTTGVLATLTTTTATNIVSGTPGATGTNLVADLHGTAQLPASANTLNIMVSTATSADAVTVLQGSYCSLTP